MQGLHSASAPGILTLDVSPNSTKVLTGGNDKNVVIFDRQSEQVGFLGDCRGCPSVAPVLGPSHCRSLQR